MDKAYHSITSTRAAPVFIFGDHASKHIPEALDNLGLSGDDLTRHIAWDIGTDVIVKYLCEHFGCEGLVASVSRLVIDMNRGTDMPSSIPVESDGTPIPGNQNLSDEEKQRRINTYHTPYHAELSARLQNYDDPLVISMHSFTPKPNLGDLRLVDIGLLVKHDEVSAEALRQQFLRSGDDFNIGINEPYSAHILNYTIDTIVAARGMRHLAIEVNQRHIDTDAKALSMAKILADRLTPIVEGTFRPISE